MSVLRAKRSWCAGLVLLAWLFAAQAMAAVTGVVQVAFTVDEPLAAAHAPGDPSRLFIAQRGGRIDILNLDTLQIEPQPFLTVPGVDTVGEGGLLGLAFHPDFATNGRFYVHATLDPGDANPGFFNPFVSTVLEYTVSAANPNLADPTPRTILEVQQPFSNHNGGWIGFNPAATSGESSYLYLTIGDGGDSSPGQSITGDLLGNVLRIDVDSDDFPADADRNYAIPPGNPFVGAPGEDEIYAYGLRNPYRASIDRVTGDLWIGDVGEGSREEVNVLRSGGGGENFGWNACEGLLASGACSSLKATPGANVVDPVYDYGHFGDTNSPEGFRGVSVIGGHVYRGPDPDLRGRYFFGDVFPESDGLWSLDAENPVGSIQNVREEFFPGASVTPIQPVAFAEDAVGNLYILTRFGGVYQVVTEAPHPGDANGDGVVDILDLDILSANFGAQIALYSQGDFNSDTKVDILDLDILSANFGSSAAASVPEPLAAPLFLIACSIGFPGRRDR